MLDDSQNINADEKPAVGEKEQKITAALGEMVEVGGKLFDRNDYEGMVRHLRGDPLPDDIPQEDVPEGMVKVEGELFAADDVDGVMRNLISIHGEGIRVPSAQKKKDVLPEDEELGQGPVVTIGDHELPQQDFLECMGIIMSLLEQNQIGLVDAIAKIAQLNDGTIVRTTPSVKLSYSESQDEGEGGKSFGVHYVKNSVLHSLAVEVPEQVVDILAQMGLVRLEHAPGTLVLEDNGNSPDGGFDDGLTIGTRMRKAMTKCAKAVLIIGDSSAELKLNKQAVDTFKAFTQPQEADIVTEGVPEAQESQPELTISIGSQETSTEPSLRVDAGAQGITVEPVVMTGAHARTHILQK